jgi:hypothetical protein
MLGAEGLRTPACAGFRARSLLHLLARRRPFVPSGAAINSARLWSAVECRQEARSIRPLPLEDFYFSLAMAAIPTPSLPLLWM